MEKKEKYVSERMITTTTSVYFSLSGYADMHIEKIYQKHRVSLQQQETHPNHRGRLQRSAWTLGNIQQEKDLDKVVVDDTELCGTQYNIQKIP